MFICASDIVVAQPSVHIFISKSDKMAILYPKKCVLAIPWRYCHHSMEESSMSEQDPSELLGY